MKISSNLVKKLRELTGVGILDCKKALLKKNGDINKSIDYLRKKGKSKALNKTARTTLQGSIFSGTKNKFGVLLEVNCETDFVAQEENFINFGKEIVNTALKKKICDFNVLKKVFEFKRIHLVSILNENIKISRYFFLQGDFLYFYLHRTRIGVLLKSNSNDSSLIKYLAMHIVASKPLYLSPENIPQDILLRERKIQLSRSLELGKNISIAEKIVSGRMKKFIGEISLIKQKFVIDPKITVEKFLKENNIVIKNFMRFEVGEYLFSS
ncbi:translation elongation factor Ts [Buchnera aphidicola]|uniref:translation elongation factor Ts n=1 Tax=Buchnera aphidicola TaxID=9 RepID=UPI002092C607|nr:translation elongation factor Ts [Buchnera aphidicola]USS94283.1 translation elongation factor Ts [Buchnera aphidicola (Sipha maydis)]WII23833.1 translation elongation factor Ts [Buchnera aphidicola (Sipha maydis)]